MDRINTGDNQIETIELKAIVTEDSQVAHPGFTGHNGVFAVSGGHIISLGTSCSGFE